MKPLTFPSLASILFFSCHDGHSGPGSSVLTKTSLYSIDTVQMAVADGDGSAAGKELQEANRTVQKRFGYGKKVSNFSRAPILLKPTAKAYFELAGALLSSRQYKEGARRPFHRRKIGLYPAGEPDVPLCLCVCKTSLTTQPPQPIPMRL